MAIVRYTYHCGPYKEHVFVYRGDVGSVNDRCGPRRKRTPEEIKRQNYINKKNRLRRIIECNFKPDDCWLDLTVKLKNRKPP